MADDVRDLLDQISRENAAARAEAKADHQETRRAFEIIAEDVRRDVRAVADGVSVNTDRIERLRSETKQEFADLRAMIKFSHADLDRRVTSLEESVADLKARVDRIEGSTH